MNKLDVVRTEKFVENEITCFHQRRLDYIENKINLSKILKQKNPYLFRRFFGCLSTITRRDNFW